jgi:hypothetical protein
MLLCVTTMIQNSTQIICVCPQGWKIDISHEYVLVSTMICYFIYVIFILCFFKTLNLKYLPVSIVIALPLEHWGIWLSSEKVKNYLSDIYKLKKK